MGIIWWSLGIYTGVFNDRLVRRDWRRTKTRKQNFGWNDTIHKTGRKVSDLHVSVKIKDKRSLDQRVALENTQVEGECIMCKVMEQLTKNTPKQPRSSIFPSSYLHILLVATHIVCGTLAGFMPFSLFLPSLRVPNIHLIPHPINVSI